MSERASEMGGGADKSVPAREDGKREHRSLLLAREQNLKRKGGGQLVLWNAHLIVRQEPCQTRLLRMRIAPSDLSRPSCSETWDGRMMFSIPPCSAPCLPLIAIQRRLTCVLTSSTSWKAVVALAKLLCNSVTTFPLCSSDLSFPFLLSLACPALPLFE